MSSFALRSITLGTVEPILFLLLALVWRTRDSPGQSGVALGAAIMLKPVVAPLLLFLLITRRVAAAGVTVLACAVIWIAASGRWYTLPSYLSLLHRLSRIEADRSQSTTALLHTHGVPGTKGDGLRGFLWPRTKYESDAEREEYARRIASAL